MFCELSNLTAIIEGAGGIVCGSVCLIDIITGVGGRKKRVSVYTIDLEKGISYRLRNKKKEYENGFYFPPICMGKTKSDFSLI